MAKTTREPVNMHYKEGDHIRYNAGKKLGESNGIIIKDNGIANVKIRDMGYMTTQFPTSKIRRTCERYVLRENIIGYHVQ